MPDRRSVREAATPMTWCWRCGSDNVAVASPGLEGKSILWCSDCIEWANRSDYEEANGREPLSVFDGLETPKVPDARESCVCGHSRYGHRHADEREVANPDATLRAECLVGGCECEEFSERPE